MPAQPFRSIFCIRNAGMVAGGLLLSAPGEQAQAQNCVALAGAARAAVMDVIRRPVATDLGAPIEFKVERARLCDPFVFVVATPQRPGGRAIRWQGTPCEGDTSHLVGALLRRKGSAWAMVDYALCPSDVAWEGWPEKYGAPPVLFDE